MSIASFAGLFYIKLNQCVVAGFASGCLTLRGRETSAVTGSLYHRPPDLGVSLSEILLRNATPTLSISERGAPIRGLRSKSRPLVICPELAIPTFFRDRLLPMFHRTSV